MDVSPQHLRGRFLFDEEMTYAYLAQRFDQGAEVKATQLTERFDGQNFQSLYKEEAISVFLLSGESRLEVFTTDRRPNPAPGDVLISLTCLVQTHREQARVAAARRG